MNVDPNTALVGILAAGIPSLVIGIVGYFLRRLIEKVESGIEKLNTTIGEHNTSLAVLEERLTALENSRIVRLEVEIGTLRQRSYELDAQIQVLKKAG